MPSVNPARSIFQSRFGHWPAHEFSVPLPLLLMGAPLAGGGLAIGCAVDRFLHVACESRTDGRIEIAGGFARSRGAFKVSDLRTASLQADPDPAKRVLLALHRRKVAFSGFNAVMQMDDLVTSAESLLSAQAVAMALAVRRIFPYALTEFSLGVPPSRDGRGNLPRLKETERKWLARLCQAAIEPLLRPGAGLVETLTAIGAKPWHLASINTESATLEHLPIIGEAIVVSRLSNSSRQRRCLGVALPELAVSAAEKLGPASLRTLDRKTLQARRRELNPREFAACLFLLTERARVVAAEAALRADDHAQFGQFLTQSHADGKAFRGGDTDLEDLVEWANAHPACLGSRNLSHVAACTAVHLVSHHGASDFLRHLNEKYRTTGEQKLRTAVCQPVAGPE